MKIEKVRLRHVFGTIETEGTFWEERLVTPLDVYPEFRDVTKRVEWSKQATENETSKLLPTTTIVINNPRIGHPTHFAAVVVEWLWRNVKITNTKIISLLILETIIRDGRVPKSFTVIVWEYFVNQIWGD